MTLLRWVEDWLLESPRIWLTQNLLTGSQMPRHLWVKKKKKKKKGEKGGTPWFLKGLLFGKVSFYQTIQGLRILWLGMGDRECTARTTDHRGSKGTQGNLSSWYWEFWLQRLSGWGESSLGGYTGGWPPPPPLTLDEKRRKRAGEQHDKCRPWTSNARNPLGCARSSVAGWGK